VAHGDDRFPRQIGDGQDWIVGPGDTADTLRFSVKGDLYPRVVIDPLQGFLFGDGTAPPQLVVGGSVGIPTPVVTLLPVPFEANEPLQAGIGDAKFPLKGSATLVQVDATVGQAPVGRSIIVDVNRNGTTVFTTQGNRPQIASGTFASSVTAIDVAPAADGDVYTVDIDQIGLTGSEGQTLTVVLWFAYVSAGTVTDAHFALPAGGTDGQFLRKLTNVDGVSQWVTLPSGLIGIPAGGTTGQVLTKNSDNDYDAGWATPAAVGAPGSGLSHVVFARDWTAGDTWGVWTAVPVSDEGNTNAFSVVSPTSKYRANTDAKMGRIALASGVAGSDRRVYLPPGVAAVDDLELQIEWRARNWITGGKPQFGHAHRIQNIGNDITQIMFMVWIDTAFAQDDVLNIGIWKGRTPGATFNQIDAVNRTLERLDQYLTVYQTRRQFGIVQYAVESDHKVLIGDWITVSGLVDGSFGVGAATPVVAVDDNIIMVAQAGADTGWADNRGWLAQQSSFPMMLASRTLDDIFEAKAWRSDYPVPSWSDPNATIRLVSASAPTGPGFHGILAAHIADVGESLDVGPIVMRTPTDRP
jgi:hypothetical protein